MHGQTKKEKYLTEFTPFLSKTYYSINFGSIFYPFSNQHLKEGFSTETFSKNRFSGRLLLGYKFAPNFSAQFGVMRPASWFKYDNVNNIGYERSVWINAWSLTLKKNFSIATNWSLYGEVGYANVTRVGFDINYEQIYDDAHFGSLIYGAGLHYNLNKKWKLSLNTVYIPESKVYNQPQISQASVGFEYHMVQYPKDSIKAFASNKHFFPKSMVQVSYGNGNIGYGTNKFFSAQIKVGDFESFGVPIFWVGEAKTAHAFSVTYQKTAYRTKKVFSLDWGLSITAFQTEITKQNVLAFSVFPVLRFYVLRKKGFDMYTDYSIIGPTFLTKDNIGGFETGPQWTYQDKMGLGIFFGKERKYNAELRIMHYSNGNIFTQNGGVAIPLQFTLGRTFK